MRTVPHEHTLTRVTVSLTPRLGVDTLRHHRQRMHTHTHKINPSGHPCTSVVYVSFPLLLLSFMEDKNRPSDLWMSGAKWLQTHIRPAGVFFFALFVTKVHISSVESSFSDRSPKINRSPSFSHLNTLLLKNKFYPAR